MKRAIVAAAVAVIAAGCMARIDSVVASVNPAGWSSGEGKTVVYTNDDTVSLRTLKIVLRYDKRFAGRDLRLGITVLTPDSLRAEERIEIAVPSRRGDVSRDSETVEPFRMHARLSALGDYRFDISPVNGVEGVTAVGIEISKEEPTE